MNLLQAWCHSKHGLYYLKHWLKLKYGNKLFSVIVLENILIYFYPSPSNKTHFGSVGKIYWVVFRGYATISRSLTISINDLNYAASSGKHGHRQEIPTAKSCYVVHDHLIIFLPQCKSQLPKIVRVWTVVPPSLCLMLRIHMLRLSTLRFPGILGLGAE